MTRAANEYERADHERDLRKHEEGKDWPFGRQGKPTVITITGGERIDRDEMFHKLNRWFLHESGSVDFSIEADSVTLRYYPNAVNN